MSLHTVQRLQTLKKHRVLKEIRKNKNIVILKPDKGNGVVVLDRSDYDQGILKIINDSSKFRPIKEDPTLSREGRLQRLLRKLKKNGHTLCGMGGIQSVNLPRPQKDLLTSLSLFGGAACKTISLVFDLCSLF